MLVKMDYNTGHADCPIAGVGPDETKSRPILALRSLMWRRCFCRNGQRGARQRQLSHCFSHCFSHSTCRINLALANTCSKTRHVGVSRFGTMLKRVGCPFEAPPLYILWQRGRTKSTMLIDGCEEQRTALWIVILCFHSPAGVSWDQEEMYCKLSRCPALGTRNAAPR